jgi:thioester reductase-like protein
MAGLALMMVIAVLGSTAVMNHPAAAITREHVLSILNQGIVTEFSAADSILTDLSATKEGLEALSKLECIAYGGGSLSPQTGAILASHVKNLSSIMGMTEDSIFHGVTLRGTSLWDCLRFNSNVGYRFEEMSPDIYELVISLRPEYAKFHPAALLFPDLEEFATKDLYTRVPEIENGYRYQGRRDDLIILSNGEKINPLPLEAIVATHPLVKSALFAGEHRFLPSLLIELADGNAVHNERESREIIERLWDIISEANLQAPRFSRVLKSLVYILGPMESFNRSPKGSIQRQVTVRTLASRIDALYAAAAEEDILTDGLEVADLSAFDSIKHLANKLYHQILGFDDDKVLGDDDDVFELGMDSLQAAVAVLKLKAVFRAKDFRTVGDRISPHFLYSSPSSSKLARSIQNLIKNEVDSHTDRRVYMQELIDKYSAGLDVKLLPKKARRDNLTVVLTGSTGSLGSYLLQSLINSPRVSKIICLNRSRDAQKRQTAGNKSRGLPIPWESEDDTEKTVEFLIADLSSPDLGLGEAIYSKLQATVNAIIHNAWKVDFNHTVESFERTHIAGTRHLIDLSRKCEYQAPILFVSTISTAMNWTQKPVPESSIHDLNSPAFIGYAESKYVAERLIEAHASSAGFTSSVMRVGQIAGPVMSTAGGVWNMQEWFPSLLASSKYLGLLPESLGTMDDSISWIPVDILARIIVQLFVVVYDDDEDDDENRELAVYNLVNPRTMPWSALLETVQISLGGPDKIRTVSLASWIEALERSAQDTHGLVANNNPATKLLDFWRNVADQSRLLSSAKKDEKPADNDNVQREFEVANLQSHSSEARNLQAVSPEWMKVWMRQWAF